MDNFKATEPHATAVELVPIPSKLRSQVTNGRLHEAKVDGRSAHARRWRDLYALLLAELPPSPNEPQRQLVRRTATMMVMAEKMEAELASGELPNADIYLRLTGTLSRTLATLGLEIDPRDTPPAPPPTLAEIAAGRDSP